MTTDISTSEVDLNDFDDFLNDSFQINTPATDKAPSGNNIFNSPPDEVEAMLSLEPEIRKALTPEERTADIKATADATAALKELDDDLSSDDNDSTTNSTSKAGRPKVEKSGLIEAVKKLIEDGVLDEFEDEEDDNGNVKPGKSLDDYSVAECIELIKLNQQSKVDAVKANTPSEFFKALPEELQYAAKYVSDGGTDLKSLFRVLGEVEVTRALDARQPEDQEHIVRNYLQAKQFGTADEIEEQIDDYKASNTLGKWAAKHKPALDDMQQEQVEAKLQQQEVAKQRQIEMRDMFLRNVHNALKDGVIGGVTIDKKTQQKLWDDMTKTNYQTMRGQRTNKLGHLLEQAQFGETPNYQLIAEVTMLLEDREGYHKKFGQKAVNDTVKETVRTLKTEQGRKVASTGTQNQDEDEQKTERKKLARPTNIFGR